MGVGERTENGMSNVKTHIRQAVSLHMTCRFRTTNSKARYGEFSSCSAHVRKSTNRA